MKDENLTPKVEDSSMPYVPQSVHKLLDYILSLSLSSDNQRWLADHLYENLEAKKSDMPPYTIEELNARIDEAEDQIARGEEIQGKDLFDDMRNYVNHRS